ncbi:MAG: acetylxylan esterase, partial [Phycisphaeraceae bacterium]
RRRLPAALDDGFAGAISNQSGCAGAALHRGKRGERIADIVTRFPYWFCPAFADWIDRDDELPFDQDALLKLIAPRPVVVLSAADDDWADPEAERRCAETVGASYHCRAGGHDLLEEDWMRALDFLEQQGS